MKIIIEKHKSYNQKDFLKTAFDLIFYPKNGEEWTHSTWLKWQKTCPRYRLPMGTWKGARPHYSSKKCKLKPQWDITSHLWEWLLSKRQETTCVDKVWIKEKPYTWLVGVKWCGHYGSCMFLKKLKMKLPSHSNLTSGYIFKGNIISNSKRYLQSHMHCVIIHSNYDMETTFTHTME